jgi:hypothetical protein
MAILFCCCVLTPKKSGWGFRRRCASGGMVRYLESHHFTRSILPSRRKVELPILLSFCNLDTVV